MKSKQKKNYNNILFPFILWFAKLGYFVWYFWWLTYCTFSCVSLSSHPNTCPFRFGWLLRHKGKNKKKFGNPEQIISSFFKSVKDPPVTSSNFNCRKMHTEWWRLSVTKNVSQHEHKFAVIFKQFMGFMWIFYFLCHDRQLFVLCVRFFNGIYSLAVTIQLARFTIPLM